MVIFNDTVITYLTSAVGQLAAARDTVHDEDVHHAIRIAQGSVRQALLVAAGVADSADPQTGNVIWIFPRSCRVGVPPKQTERF
jgi:hypothetical protein